MSAHRNAKILVVEDSPLQAEMLRRSLADAGYEVFVAADGQKALERAVQLLPDAIVSDVNMPVMDGYALCAAIRRDPRFSETPFVLVTGLSDSMDVLRGLEAGADAYLTKPYNVPALAARLESLLAHTPAGSGSGSGEPTEIRVGGRSYTIRTGAQRMLNLLVSTYENAVLQNRELAATQLALEELNANLEQKVIEKTAAVLDSERRFRALIEHASDLVAVVDPQGLVTFVGPSIERMTGYDAAAVLGCELSAFLHPSCKETCHAAMQRLRDQPYELQTFELLFRHKGDRYVTFEAIAKNKIADPVVCGIILNLRDITERRRAEERVKKLSMAVEQSPDTVIIADVDGNIEYVNEAFVRSTGWARDEILGRNVASLRSGDTPQHAYDALREALGRGASWKGTFHNRRKDGVAYLSEALVTPIRDPNGTISNYVSVQCDVTEKRRTEAELEQYRHHLEAAVAARTTELEEARWRADEANLAKSAFLANMSHEIRTPMNAVIGLTYMLRRNDPRPDQDEKIGKIAGAAEHLLSIINDVLDLSKIEADGLVLEQTEFHLRDVVSRAISMLSERANAKGLRLKVKLEGVPFRLRGDRTRLTQAFLNLGTNAVKFTERGSVTLRVSLLEEREDDALLRFEVVDTGVGIAPHVLPKLFSRFVQADASTTRTHGGTGLGLAITRRLAELMGGAAGVESELGVGSTFFFTARLQKAGPASEGLERLSAAEAPEVLIARKHRRARVLLVEDNELNQEVARELLAAAELDIEIANDGVEAIEKVRTAAAPYRLVLMDMQMPRMDGVEATREIRKLYPSEQLPVLAMTANAFADDWDRCSAAGMDDFIAKPIVTERLFETLLRWLGG